MHVTAQTTIGDGCTIYPFVSLGTPPQSLSYRGEPTRLEIGGGCTIRESVTMNAGTVAGGGVTRVGERGYFMNCSHVGHDCQVGNNVIFATSATLGGHCEIGDFVFIGGLSAVHQFTRIGPQVMVGGVCGVRGDVIPFGLVNGQYASLEGLNIVGMKRRKFTKSAARQGTRVLSEAVSWSRNLRRTAEQVQPLAAEDPAIAEILAFIGDGKHARCAFPPTTATGSDDGNAAAMTSAATEISSPVGVIAGGGAMPFAVADCSPRAASSRCCFRCRAPAIRHRSRDFVIAGFRSANSAKRRGCFARRLPRPRLHRHAGAALAVGDPARLRNAAATRARSGRHSGAATITCCPA